MKIPNPQALCGDKVQVLNYRCNPRQWVDGECRCAEYKNTGNHWYWLYTVYIRKGKGYFLYVSCESIKKDK